jgi:hypothetical protein
LLNILPRLASFLRRNCMRFVKEVICSLRLKRSSFLWAAMLAWI